MAGNQAPPETPLAGPIRGLLRFPSRNSGILRLADLIALQPNINIDLYIVAPGSRRSQVAKQLNRPTFKRLPKPLHRMCQFIPYDKLSSLDDRVEGVAGFVQVEFIKTIAEDCG